MLSSEQIKRRSKLLDPPIRIEPVARYYIDPGFLP
jgi:hypothetical protein